MNVLNQLDSESSSDSDGNAMEDRVAVEDGGHSENKSDQVTNISSQAVSIESDSSMRSGNSSVSLLSVLKAPNMSELSRKRKVTKNPPTGKRRARSSCPSNPKGIKPQQRVKEYPTEPFIVSSSKLFCQGCREELPLKKSSISYHIKSTKHSDGKKRLEQRKVKDKDIAESLRKYNEEVHARGETLPEQQQVFRVKVVKTFLQADVPLSKVGHFRELLEETGHRLTDRRHLFDLIPFILEEEKQNIKLSIQGKWLSVIFDGTSHCGEALAILVRYIDDSWNVQQQLLCIRLLSKSLTGEEIAHELIQELSINYSISTDHLIAAMRDRASVNGVAMRTVKIVYPKIFDVGCFSHTIDRVGEHFNIPNLTEFVTNWLTLFSHSIKAKFLWKQRTGQTMASYSATRWWSKWELMKQMMVQFGEIEPFLNHNTDLGPSSRPRLLAILTNPEKLKHLKLELASVIDWGEVFVKATYNLEGDGPLALTCYEEVQRVVAAIRVAHTPNTEAIIRTISTQTSVQQRLRIYAKNCVQKALEYFQHQLESSLQVPMSAFKAVQIFNPHKLATLKPDVSHVNSLRVIPAFEDSELERLKAELPTYIAKADGISSDLSALEWWKLNSMDLPSWSHGVKKVLAIQPSSAAAERVFSLLNTGFGDLQDNALRDYIEASVMLRFNHNQQDM